MQSAINSLTNAGIRYEDAVALRRISMTLHRWHELECGDGNNYAPWSLVRGKKTGNVFEHDDDGKPYLEHHANSTQTNLYPERDELRHEAAQQQKLK